MENSLKLNFISRLKRNLLTQLNGQTKLRHVISRSIGSLSAFTNSAEIMKTNVGEILKP